MQPRSEARPGSRVIAAVLCGFLCSTSVVPSAFSQPKAPAKAAVPPVPKPAAAGGKGAAAPMSDADRKASARKHYEQGKKLLESNDYAGALTEFKAADELIPAPQAEHKIAVCLDKLGRVSEAIRAYEEFLSRASPEKMQDLIDGAKERIESLKKAPVTVKVTSDPAQATVEVDGTPQMGVTPLDLKIPAGKHKVKVVAPDYEPSQQEVDLAPGEKAPDLTFTLNKKTDLAPVASVSAAPPPGSAPPPPPAEPPPPMASKSNTAAYVTLGIAGAGLIVGTIFGVKALGDKSDFKSNPTTAKADTADRDALIADMAFGAAITLGVTGVVLLTTGGSSGAAPKKTASEGGISAMRLAPVVTPHGGGAAAVWRF